MIGSVVVLYNPSKDEILNINTYLDSVNCAVVVDNSECDHKELVYSLLSNRLKIEYYTEHKNLGLCRGLNIGVDLLVKRGCEWALLFDADSKIDCDILSVYKKAMLDYKGQNVAVFSPVHMFDRRNNHTYNGYKKVEWSMTSGWLINVEIFKKQKGFFEPLFVDGLDMDYCFRSHENGYEIIECGEAVLNHSPAETKSFLGFKYGIASPFRYHMQARQLIWCWKRYKKNKALFIYLYKWIKVLFLFTHKKAYIKEMRRGTIEGNRLWKEFKRKTLNLQ